MAKAGQEDLQKTIQPRIVAFQPYSINKAEKTESTNLYSLRTKAENKTKLYSLMHTLSTFIFLFSFLVVSGPAAPDETASNIPVGSCDRYDHYELSSLPRYEISAFQERWDPWYSTHYTASVVFADGVRAKVFMGGISKKYFIGDSSGGKHYYVSVNATVRAVYLYKKYGCISKKYQTGFF